MRNSERAHENLPMWRLSLAAMVIALVVGTWMKLGMDQEPFTPCVALIGSGAIVLATSDLLTLCIPTKDLTHSLMRVVSVMLGFAAAFSYVIN